MENNRVSIVEELSALFANHCASAAAMAQAFFARSDDELRDFALNCPANVRAAIDAAGFNVPAPQILNPVVAVTDPSTGVTTDQPVPVPVETQAETDAWKNILAFFGL